MNKNQQLLQGHISRYGAPEYDDIMQSDLPTEEKVRQIQIRGQAYNDEIDRQLLKDYGRIGLGTAISGASFHPILNIPYVGTGLGGAMYELGQGMVEGNKLPEILKRAGQGFLVGETVGAVPYVGKAAGKTKAGQAIGEKVSNLAQKIAETPAWQKIEDVLMTDIKNLNNTFNPNKQTVYHGSPYDFEKFSNEAIGTGEGAQVHGSGHYAALDKDIADKRYRMRLTPDDYRAGGKQIFDKEKRKLIKEVFENGKENTIKKYENEIVKYNKIMGDIEKQYPKNELWNNTKYTDAKHLKHYAEEDLKTIKSIDENTLYKNEGQLYKLSIPKDDVFLREDLPLNQQPQKVQNAIDKYIRENYQGNPNDYDYNKALEMYDYLMGVNNGRKFYNQVANMELSKFNKNPEKYGYMPSKIDLNNSAERFELASKKLNDLGIKGISYNGGIDGEARVIFNPDDIDIVRRYYNQPNLYDYLMKNSPNIGAATSAIEDILRNPVYPMGDGFKNYEKLGLDYYKNNLQPNPVDIDGYGTVYFGRHNRGKDDITNFRVYPDLREQLMSATRGERTNYNDEADRMYDYFYNTYDGDLYKYLIEDINGIGKRYKKMRNMRTNK